jgi:hypothetical protein
MYFFLCNNPSNATQLHDLHLRGGGGKDIVVD